jgi:hypothetical protein
MDFFWGFFFFTNRRLENRNVGQKNEGFNEERVLSVCTGSSDKIVEISFHLSLNASVRSVGGCLVMLVTKRDRWESTSQRASNV